MSDERLLWMVFGNALFFFVPRDVRNGVIQSWQLGADAVMPVPSMWEPVAETGDGPVLSIAP